MSKLYIGWSEVNITPDKKISLWGQFAERISEYVEKPLTATAMAVECCDDQMIMISTDLVGVSLNLMDDVRARLADNKLGLDPQKIIISAIHTHTGPGYTNQDYISKNLNMGHNFRTLLESELPADRKYVESAPISANPEVATDAEVYALLLDRITQAALDAWTSRAPGSYTNAFGRAVVGMCRRATYSDGSAQMWGDTNTAMFEPGLPCPVCPAPSLCFSRLLG